MVAENFLNIVLDFIFLVVLAFVTAVVVAGLRKCK